LDEARDSVNNSVHHENLASGGSVDIEDVIYNTHGLAVMSEDDTEADTLYDMVGLTHSSCK